MWTAENCTVLLAKSSGTDGRGSVSRQKTYSSEGARITLRVALHVATPTLTFSPWACAVSGAHILCLGMGDYSLIASKDIGMGVTDLALVDRSQWLAQLAPVGKLTQALLVRTDLPTYATLATRQSVSEKWWQHLANSTSCHIATWLCEARECSMTSTIVSEPLSAPTSAQPRTMTRDILWNYYWLCARSWIGVSGWRSVYCSGWLSSHWLRTWRRLWSRGQVFRCMLRWRDTRVILWKRWWQHPAHSSWEALSYSTSCHIATSTPFFLNRHSPVFPPDSRIAYFGLLVRQIQTLARACLDRPWQVLNMGNVTSNVPVNNTISYSKTDPLQICTTPTTFFWHNVVTSPFPKLLHKISTFSQNETVAGAYLTFENWTFERIPDPQVLMREVLI